MDKDRIINEIVSEVLLQLNTTNKHMAANTNVDMREKNSPVYIIGNMPSQYNTKGMECIPIKQGYHKGDIILITSLSPYMLADLANGQATTFEEDCILYNLLHGYDVFILEDGFEYQSYKRTAFKALYNLYRDYDNKLRNYGVRVIQEPIEIITSVSQSEFERFSKKNSIIDDLSIKDDQLLEGSIIGKVDWRKRHLLLEKDFVNSRIKSNRIVMLRKECIITPMARDYIREHQIHIELY